MPLTPEQAAAVTQLGREAKGLNTKLDSIKRWSFWRSVILVVAVIVIGFYAFSVHNDLNKDQSRTATARVNSCRQYNVQQRESIAHDVARDLTLADLLVPKPRAREEQTAVDLGLARLKATSELTTRRRDCTPDGIADYLAGRGGYYVPVKKS